MNKKILLGAAISFASFQVAAVPFAPTDARAMAMGGTGVASSEVASTLQYNPALLANTRQDDHFGLTFPTFGVSFADEDDFIDEVEDFDEESPEATPGSGDTNIDLLSNVLDIASDNVNGLPAVATAAETVATITEDIKTNGGVYDVTDLQNANNDLNGKIGGLRGTVISTDDDPNTPADSDLVKYADLVANDLDDLNSKGIRINGGGGLFAAIPSKKFSVGIGVSAQAVFSGTIFVPKEDSDQLRNYTQATDGYLLAAIGVTSATSALITAQQALDADDGSNPTVTQGLVDDVTAAITNLETAQGDYTGYDYGGANTPADDGDAVIFENGELVANDTQLNSTVHMVGAVVADVGLTVSRVFNIASKDIAIGVTPKMQAVTIFDYIFELDGKDENGNDVEFNEDDISENTVDYTEFNLDIGAAHQFGAENQWQAGLVIKNLMAKDFESANGATVSISPMVRAGISHKTNWTKVAFDLDLTENDPIAFEDATQFAALGAELNVWRIVQLRAGYRANLAASGQDVVTAGIGFSPLAVRIDLGVMANANDPEKEAGIAFDLGVEF